MGKVKFLSVFMLVFMLVFLNTVSGVCQEGEIEEGITWLNTNQNEDGYWGDLPESLSTPFHSTSEVLTALHHLGKTGEQIYLNGVQWIGEQDVSLYSDYLARQTEVLAESGADVTEQLSTLLSYQNTDGGWGSYSGYSSETLDTILVLSALTSCNYSDTTVIGNAIGFILSQQNADGSFGFEDGVGSVYLTSSVLLALSPYQSTYNISAQIDSASTWLLAQQNEDGSFGTSVFETALAYSALVRTTSAPTETQEALDYIESSQLANGSWNDNAFETALALRALADAKPNLTLSSSDIVFTPATVHEGDIVKITATVRNPSPLAIDNVPVRFYLGLPSEGNQIDTDQLISGISAGGTGVVEVSWHSSGYSGLNDIYAAADPENTIEELSENDNVSHKAIRVLIKPVGFVDLVILPENMHFEPANPTEGDIVTLTAFVGNQGQTNLSNVEVSFYVGLVAPENQVGTQTIGKIDSGTYGEAQIAWDTSGKTGAYTIYVVIDPEDTISEDNEANNNADKSITIAERVNLPDLSISNISSSDAGNDIQISAAVSNKGLISASNVPVKFYNGNPEESGVQMGSDEIISSIVSGGSVEVSVSEPFSSGEYDIYVVADVDNTIEEGNEANNTGILHLTVAIPRDLVITAGCIGFNPPSPTEGEIVTISANVGNAGGTTLRNIEVDFYEGEIVEENRIGTTQIISAIPSGGYGEAHAGYDTAGKEGTHTIHAVVDKDNEIVEDDETNNTASRSLGVEEAVNLPDLALSNITSSQVGEYILITAGVSNLGNLSANNVVVRFYDGNPSEGAVRINGEQTIAALSGGVTGDVSVTWTPTAGEHPIYVVVDEDNTIEESNELNNTGIITITIVEVVDLVTWDDRIYFEPAFPTEGDSVTITGFVGNQGSKDVVDVEVAIYEDSIAIENKIGSQVVSSIGKGMTKSIQVSWDTTGKEGTHTIYLVADPGNSISEGDEDNNTASASMTVAEKVELPDFTVTYIELSNWYPETDEEIAITAQVTNKGLVSAVDIIIRFYDGEPGEEGTVVIGEGTIPSLEPDAMDSASVSWTAAPQGEHKIYVVADADNTIVEGNEQNNGSYAAVNVGVLPDLVISDEDISFSNPAPQAGEQFTITAVIHNTGEIPAKNVSVRFYDGNPEEGGKRIGDELFFSTIGPGVTGAANLTCSLSERTHTIYVRVDEDNLIVERDETNNSASKSVTVAAGALPDLSITSEDITFSNPAPQAGEPFTITAIIRNVSSTNAENVVVQFFDGDSGEGGVQIWKDMVISGIAGGSGCSIGGHLSLREGRHDIYVRIDPYDTIAESDETNNEASQSIDVSSGTLPDLTLNSEEIIFSKDDPIDGDKITITIPVHNAGLKDAYHIYLHFYEDLPSSYGLRIGGDVYIERLAAGESRNIEVGWIAREGTFNIYVEADPYHLVAEEDEGNNHTWKQLEVGPSAVPPAQQEEINEAIDGGIAWLKSRQRGNGGIYTDRPLGETCLAILAMLHGGLTPDDESVARAIDFILPLGPDWAPTYTAALKIWTLVATENKAEYLDEVGNLSSYLISLQYGDGSFSYGDLSNTQFGLLGLYAAKQWAVEVPDAVWSKAENYIKTNQREDGGWDYAWGSGDPWGYGSSRGSMTTAALMSLKICRVPLDDNSIQRGFNWLNEHFTVSSNPGLGLAWHYYYLWSLERACVIPPYQKYIGEHDWYQEGATYLVNAQLEGGRWSNPEEGMPWDWVSDETVTCFALFFLQKSSPPPLLPDLDLVSGDMSFSNNNPSQGETIIIIAEVRNEGSDIGENIPVRFYDGNPNEGGIQIGEEQIISTLTVGDSTQISTDWQITSSGTHQIYVMVDPLNLIEESDETNNMAYKEIEVGADVSYTLSAAADKPSYSPYEELTAAMELTNTGSISGDGVCEVRIEDEEGNVVASLGDIPVEDLVSGDALTEERLWDVSNTAPGAYRVHALFSQEGSLVIEAFASFTVLAETGIESTLTTDRIFYSSNETVGITSKVKSLSSNFIYENLSVNVSILNPGDELITAEERTIAQLLPKATDTVRIYWSTGDHSPGIYTVSQKVYYQGELVSEVQTTFRIAASHEEKKGVAGSIDAVPSTVEGGSAFSLAYTIRNTGNVDLSDILLEEKIIDPDTQEPVYEHSEIVDSLAKGETYSSEITDISTLSLQVGSYMLVLTAVVDGSNIPVDSGFVEIVDITAPVTTLIPSGEIEVVDGENYAPVDYTYTLTAEDDFSGVERIEYRIDEGEWIVYSEPFGLEEGEHTIYYNALDCAGNREEARAFTVNVYLPTKEYAQWRYDYWNSGVNPNIEEEIPGGCDNRILDFTLAPKEYVRSSPVVLENRLYQASFKHPGWKGYLRCFDINSGGLIWEEEFSEAINHSTPAIWDGTLYIGTDEGNLEILNAETGEILSAYGLGAPYIDSSPCVFRHEGKTYLVIGEGTEGYYYHCLDVTDPANPFEVWNYGVCGGAWSSPAAVKVEVDDEGVMAAFFGSGWPDHRVYAVKVEDGSALWTYDTGSAPGNEGADWENVSAAPCVVDGIVYVGDENGVFHAIDASTGEAVWTRMMEGIDGNEAEYWENSIHSSAAVYEGKVYFGVGGSDYAPKNKKYRFYCLNAQTGDIIWSYKFPKKHERVWGSPMIAGGVVYIGTCKGAGENDTSGWKSMGQGKMYAFDVETGELKWEDSLNGKICGSPFIQDGRIYITRFKKGRVVSWGVE